MCTLCPAELARDLDGSFATAVEHYQGFVYGMARRLTRNPADAEDLAQDAFIRAYRALRTYDAARVGDLHLSGWLARITLNLARNRARDAEPVGVELESAQIVADAPAAQPDAVVQRREEARDWSCLLEALPARYGRAVALRHVDGLSYPELAVALDKPVNTVKSDVHRGVALLRAAYVARGGGAAAGGAADSPAARQTLPQAGRATRQGRGTAPTVTEVAG